jgi:hypothetical protein
MEKEEIKTRLFKREWHDKHKKYDCVYNTLRRMNRETKSQLISDAQRTPVDWSAEPIVWINFQVVAKRYRKNRLFNLDGTLSNYYGNSTLIKGDITPLVGDKPFEDMFKIVKCLKANLFGYEMSLWAKLTTFQKSQTQAYCCIDDDNYINKHLGELFGLPVYFVERIFNKQTGRFNFNFKKSNDYERNVVFYQVTSSGGDKKVITNEENDENCPILIWAFKDKIVYKMTAGYNEW